MIWRYPWPARLSLLLAANQNVNDTHLLFVCRPTLLEPTRAETLPTLRTLAPLVFSANQQENDIHHWNVCAVPCQKKHGGVRLPSNAAPKKG